MSLIPRIALAVFLLGATTLAASAVSAATAESTNLPFWRSSAMENEPLFFIQGSGQETASANLLFMPDKVSEVTSADGSIAFKEGTDYVLKPGTHTLSLLPGSRIPFKTLEQMRPPLGAPQSISAFVGGKRNLFFGEGHLFHDLQVKVSYVHQDRWAGYEPAFAGAQLTKTIAKLGARQPLKLVVLGDSISTGANASKFTGVAPYQPGYPELTATGLQAHYGAPVTLTNLSVGGMTSPWGLAQVKAVVAEKPDLVVIAFGMNDASGSTAPSYFSRTIKKTVDGIALACPDAEFIVVATMTGNPDWTGAGPKLYPRYRDELLKLVGPGVALADMTAMWTDVLRTKSFADITGNGVNHPNDFGHRLYGDVLMGLLVP